MRILYLNSNGTFGGAERSLLDLMQAVRRARPNWTLELMTASPGDLIEAALEIGVSTSILQFPPALARVGDAAAGGPAGNTISRSGILAGLIFSTPQAVGYVLKLRRMLGERAPDVVHSNGFKMHILAAWAAPRRSKVIWHVRDYTGSRPLMSRLMRLHAGRCAAAVANSCSVARDLEAACAGRLRNVRAVYNAIDLERFNPRGPALDLDAMAGLPPAPAGTIRVGLVATMARWKGHEVFLHALSMLPRGLPVRGYIIGGPIYATTGSQRSVEELRALASRLGLNGSAGFTGFVKDCAAAIRALDIVIHASTEPEPFGRVIAEAMACARPVVASRTGGVTEIIAENHNALCHSPGDAAAMAGCIVRLADPYLREKLGSHARRWAKERFAPCRLAHEMIPIYESLAEAAN